MNHIKKKKEGGWGHVYVARYSKGLLGIFRDELLDGPSKKI
jgi:hypothetical protein